MRRFIYTLLTLITISIPINAKTLVVYYSYTNNVATIVNELKTQIQCDVIEIQPSEKGLDYAANNYAIGSAQIAAIRNNPDDAASYPAIDPVDVNFDEYDTVIIGAPLWWSQMAAPLQTFLFQNGGKMADKKIGLIVSSHSSGISGVVSDAKRLIPHGAFLEPALWIRSSEVDDSHSLISKWLVDIHYDDINTGINNIYENIQETVNVYNLKGMMISEKNISELSDMPSGIYIIKGTDLIARKIMIK